MPDEFTITEAARVLGVHQRSLRDWIQHGRLAARREGRRYLLAAPLVDEMKRRQDCVRGWPRLVDVARRLGIHRNLGESLCRSAGIPVAKDLHDDCRIAPEAEAHLTRELKSYAARRDWMRLKDLAEALAVRRNVLDGALRKQRLEFAYDASGHIVLPAASSAWLRAWRRQRDGVRAGETEIAGRRLYSLHHTAAQAAEKFALPGTEAHQAKTEVLITRYRYWARVGLAVTRHRGQLFLDEQTHRALVDDVSLGEASRLTGVGKGQLKRWAALGLIPQTGIAPTRKSYSYAGLLAVVAAQLREPRARNARLGIPVQTLPPWSTLAQQLHLPVDVPLARLLELAASASAEEVRTLRGGRGCVSLCVWEILDGWLRAVASGHLPRKPAMDTAEHRATLTRAPELPSILAWFAGVRREHFDQVLHPGLRGQVNPEELSAICGHLTAGGAVRAYDPRHGYRPGEFLLDAAGGDLGPVRRFDARSIEVDWMRRGPLKMSHTPVGGSVN